MCYILKVNYFNSSIIFIIICSCLLKGPFFLFKINWETVFHEVQYIQSAAIIIVENQESLYGNLAANTLLWFIGELFE